MTRRLRWTGPPLVLVALITSCTGDPDETSSGGWFEARRALYGGTPARIKIWLPPGRASEAQAITAAGWTELARLGRLFNAFDPRSEIGRLNASRTAGPVEVSADLAAVFRVAQRVHSASAGAFDPTLWPVKHLWREAVLHQRPPSEAQLRATLARVGLTRLRLEMDPPRLTRATPGVQLDLGGIVKGYAVDRVGQLLHHRQVPAALVQIGGEILAFGASDVGPWRLGIRHPCERGRLFGVVQHRGTVRVSTSGNYQQPLRIGSELYYHIFAPDTGRPASTRVRGVTLASFDSGPDNSVLDAAATAAVVLGAERGAALARALGAQALLIEGNPGALREVVTPGFAARWRRTARSSD